MKVAVKKNTRRVWILAITLAVIGSIVAFVFWTRGSVGAGGAGSSSTTTQAGPMTQVNEGGQITMKITWQGRNAGPVFAVEMDTHTVNLDGYDLQKLSSLRIDRGQEIQPTSWSAPSGGHHRSSVLTFPTTLADGTPVIGPNTRTLELVIRSVGSVPERTFSWTL